MKKRSILLIGAGALGYRYFEGLLKLQSSIKIHVIDLSYPALDRIKDCYEKCTDKERIELACSDNFANLDKSYDLVIISTNSDVRFKIFEKLLENTSFSEIIFEKVLFQRKEEYQKVSEYLIQKKISAHVNHPRRAFPFYQKLKAELVEKKIKSFKVTGPNWGLACNGLHFIDLFIYLTKAEIKSIKVVENSSTVMPSKRMGYYEIDGSIEGKLGNDIKFELVSNSAFTELKIEIETEFEKLMIIEAKNEVITLLQNGESNSLNVNKIVYYQSELTSIICQGIFDQFDPLIPAYSECTSPHLKFIETITLFFEKKLNTQLDHCPIT